MMSSAETSAAGEEQLIKPTTSQTTTTTSTTAMMTMNRSQPIHFININKKMANDSNNSRAAMSNDHYHHIHHIYTAPHPHHPTHHHTNSLLDHFYSNSFGHHHSGSYLSTSAGKIASNNTLNQAKSTGLYLNELINEFSNNRVSAFLPLEEVSRIFTEVQEVQEGKVDNVLRVMSFHPEFMQEFINLYNYLMYSQHGALPYDWRHYIAIMAAARHKCIYLVKQQEREFLNQNGQPAWLKHGIAHIPHKLKGLYELNKLLCHQPWLINHTHLEKILKGQFSWTVTELTMAITILTLFHSLSGFAFGCGINENYTQELSRQYEREEEENAKRKQRAAASAAARSKRRAAKKLAKKQQQQQQQQKEQMNRNNSTTSRRTVLKNGGGGGRSGVIGCIDGVEDDELSESEDQQAPDEDDGDQETRQSRHDEDDANDDDDDEDDEDDDDEDEDEDDDEDYDEEDEDAAADDDHRLVDNDHHDDHDEHDENLAAIDGRFLPQAAVSRHYNNNNNTRSSRVHLRNCSSTAVNTHCSVGDSANGSAGRGRSNSTGASNRTLSNSSASSCELGIDMLLKEMQMIKAEDKQSHHQQQQQQQTKTSTSGGVSTSDSLSSSMLSSSCSGTTATTPSSSSSSSSLIMIQKQLARSNSPNMAQCLSPTSLTAASSSGPSTITNNSPTATAAANNTNQSYSSNNYLNDLSNTNTNNAAANRQQYGMQGSHDNNNNSIHHYNYHHFNQQNNTYHQQNNNSTNTNVNISKDMNEIMRNEVEKKSVDATVRSGSKNVVKFMESSSAKEDHHHHHHHHYNHHHAAYHHPYHHNNNNNMNTNHTAPQQQQQQQQQEPVSAHSTIVAQKIRDYMLKYAFDADYGYQDVETSGDPSLRLEYYTWENQGYITAQSVYPDICDFLDKNFQVAANMTYNTMGNVKGVDTSLFRKAVWFYTHSLYGVRHDDYDYNQIRALLKSPLRKYIKMVCTQPERITKSHYDSIMKEFAHSEKVHMNLVIMEARIQASMLYFLRAVNSYFG